MSERRARIKSVLSSVNDVDPQGINICDCYSVNQINVFSGGVIKLSTSEQTEDEKNSASESFLDVNQREKIYIVCHGIARKCSLYPLMKKYIKWKWECSSLDDLTDTDLICLLRFMRDMEMLND